RALRVWRCRRARAARAPRIAPGSRPTRAQASRTWRTRPVSRMSWVVAPRWTYSPASPPQSWLRARRTGTSGCAVGRISAPRAWRSRRSTRACRAISRAAGAGTRPSSAWAWARATSTASHFRTRFSSPKTAIMSGAAKLAPKRRDSVMWLAMATAPGGRGPSLLPGLLEELRDEGRPAGLVTGADAGAVVPVEVLVEEEVIPPMGIRLELLRPAVDRPPSVGPAEEEPDEAPRQLTGDLPEVEPAPGA